MWTWASVENLQVVLNLAQNVLQAALVIAKLTRRSLREFCGNQLRIVMHCYAGNATGVLVTY
jgi:hypothetical protein